MKKGERVSVRAHVSQPGSRLNYPAFTGILLEDAYSEGWDVVDVQNEQGEEVSIYSFSIQQEKCDQEDYYLANDSCTGLFPFADGEVSEEEEKHWPDCPPDCSCWD